MDSTSAGISCLKAGKSVKPSDSLSSAFCRITSDCLLYMCDRFLDGIFMLSIFTQQSAVTNEPRRDVIVCRLQAHLRSFPDFCPSQKPASAGKWSKGRYLKSRIYLFYSLWLCKTHGNRWERLNPRVQLMSLGNRFPFRHRFFHH